MFQVFAPIQCLTLIRNQIYSGWWEKNSWTCWPANSVCLQLEFYKSGSRAYFQNLPPSPLSSPALSSVNEMFLQQGIIFPTHQLFNANQWEYKKCEKGGAEGLGLEFSETKEHMCTINPSRSFASYPLEAKCLDFKDFFLFIFGFKKKLFSRFF